MKYTLVYSVDLAKALPEVGSLTERVNDDLATFGLQERVTVRSEILHVTVELPEPLSSEKEKELGHMIEQEIREKFPELDVRFDGARDKSAKSCCQSVSP